MSKNEISSTRYFESNVGQGFLEIYRTMIYHEMPVSDVSNFQDKNSSSNRL